MNYTTINIEGQEVGLRFGFPCIRWFTESGIDNPNYFDAGGSLTEIGMSKLLQLAYNNECALKEVKPVLTYDKFYLWVEEKLGEDNSEELISVINVWAQSTAVKKVVEKAEKKRQAMNQEQPTLTPSSESSMENSE